jgi:hypothetical protein
MQAARRRAGLISRAGSAGGPKPGRVGFYLGVVRRRADSSSSALTAPAIRTLRRTTFPILAFRNRGRTSVPKPIIYGARLMAVMNSECSWRLDTMLVPITGRSRGTPRSPLCQNAFGSTRSPRVSRLQAPRRQSLAVTQKQTAVPGERIVSVSLVEARAALTTQGKSSHLAEGSAAGTGSVCWVGAPRY